MNLISVLLPYGGAVAGAVVGFLLNMMRESRKRKARKQRMTPAQPNEGSLQIHYHTKLLPDIWGDFAKDFKSFNDPWIMEMRNPADFVPIHQVRYKAKDCSIFSFLFFEKLGNEPFKRFVEFQSMVHLNFNINQVRAKDFREKLASEIAERKKNSGFPDSLNKIEVCFNDDDEILQQTFFRGYKRMAKRQYEEVCLWYIPTRELVSMPYMILEIRNEGLWKHLDIEWDNAAKGRRKIVGSDIFDEYLNRVDHHGESQA